MKTIVVSTFILICLGGCSKSESNAESKGNSSNAVLVDKYADASVVALYNRLLAIKAKGVMVGHHETNAYGVGWKYNGINENSDIKKVTGDMPAVYGWDLSGIDNNSATVIDGVSVEEVTQHVKWVHENGGINTFCWHAYNPIDGKDSWQVNSTTVASILPGGSYYSDFRTRVARVAQYLKSLKDKNGNSIPILFRPWHENTGNWFWWGTTGCTSEQFKNLWISTVKLLRDTLKVNNLIYVYSPASIASESEYLERYPGDDYVDILGFDEYFWNEGQYVNNMARNVSIIRKLANERTKLFAVTETGYEKIPQSDWFTKFVYSYTKASGLSYVLFWRNADETHYYIPFEGQQSAEDFKFFVSKSDILLLEDMKSIK